jgi:hypothetical protein
MVIYVLILAIIFEGEVQFAVFNNGDRNKEHEFKTQAACEVERGKQLANMHKILAPGAVFVDLQCIARNAQGGA